jgi:hypothetical protein
MEVEMASLRSRITEREKELSCHMLLSNLLDELTLSSSAVSSVLENVIAILPPAMRFPEVAAARITTTSSAAFQTPNYRETPWVLAADVYTAFPADRRIVGRLEVVYLEERPPCDVGPFMTEELNLVTVVAERVGKYITQKLAEERISRLMGPVALCSCCRSIRDAGAWKSIEAFFREHTALDLESTICPACANTLYASTLEQHARHSQSVSLAAALGTSVAPIASSSSHLPPPPSALPSQTGTSPLI